MLSVRGGLVRGQRRRRPAGDRRRATRCAWCRPTAKVDNGSSDDAITVDLSRGPVLGRPGGALARTRTRSSAGCCAATSGRPDHVRAWTGTGCSTSTGFLLGRVRSSAEFGDLLWEVAAELGTSHAYVMPSSTFTARSTLRGAPAALLGADVARSADGRWLVAAGAAGRVVRPARPLAVRRPRGGRARGRRDPRGRRPPGRPGLRPLACAGRHRRQAGRADHPPGRPVAGPVAPGRRRPTTTRTRRRLRQERRADAGRRGRAREARARTRRPRPTPDPSATRSPAATPDRSPAADSWPRHFGLLHHLRAPAAAPALPGHGHGRILGRLRHRHRRKRRRPASRRNRRNRRSDDPPRPSTPRPAGSSSSRSTTTGGSATRTGWPARRQFVRDRSDGRVGYLHVPDMMGEGWAHLHRDLRTEMGREALIIDVRGNRGGHTSQLIVEKLARRIIGWEVPRRLRPVQLPARRAARPAGRAGRRVRGLGRRHRHRRDPQPRPRPGDRRPHLGRRGRHRRPRPRAGRRHPDHRPAVRDLVQRLRLVASRTTASTPTPRS